MLKGTFFSCLTGFSSALFLIIYFKRLVLKNKFLASSRIPLIGGPAVAAAFMISGFFSLSLYGLVSRTSAGIIFASFLMLIFGVIDDWRELSITAKILMQVIATILLIFFGIRTQIVYLGNLVNIIITLIWVLAITNAFNHLDVMDAVAATVALTISIVFFVISLINHDAKTLILSSVLIGNLISFLIYNFPPASIYLGNSGSHFLGFVLAALALDISYAPIERKVALLSPVLILGFPIFDTAFLVLMRMRKKRLPFKKSNDHLVLRFLAAGYSKKKSLFVMLFWNLFFVSCGIIVSQVSNFLGIVIITAVIITSLFLAKRMSRVVING